MLDLPSQKLFLLVDAGLRYTFFIHCVTCLMTVRLFAYLQYTFSILGSAISCECEDSCLRLVVKGNLIVLSEGPDDALPLHLHPWISCISLKRAFTGRFNMSLPPTLTCKQQHLTGFKFSSHVQGKGRGKLRLKITYWPFEKLYSEPRPAKTVRASLPAAH